MPALEAEARFIVPDELATTLLHRAFDGQSSNTSAVNLEDWWYAPVHIRTTIDHEAWLQSGSASPIRLRSVRAGRDYSTCTLEMKSPVQVGDYSTNRELSISVSDFEETDRLLRALGQRVTARISKTRTRIASESNVSVTMDTYTGGPHVVEIEILQPVSVEVAQSQIALAAAEFGLRPEWMTTEPFTLHLIRQSLAGLTEEA